MTPLLRAALLTLLVAPSVHAATFADDFGNDPFANNRWCERWHHVHWNATTRSLRAFNGTDCSGTGCCSCPTAGCSTTNAGGAFVITKNNFAGNGRTGRVDFGLSSHLIAGSNEHSGTFSVAHPKCVLGYEAVVAREAAGTYLFFINRPNDVPQAMLGDLECDDYPPIVSSAVGNLTLVTGTTVKYTTSITTQVSGSTIVSTATLRDQPTQLVLATVNWQTPLPATWYNTKAQRFGLSAIKGTGYIQYDNFVGTYVP